MSNEPNSAETWKRLARSVARKVNAGWVIDRLNPWLIGLSLIASVLVICIRSFVPELVDGSWLLIGFPTLILVAAAISWSRAHRNFIGEKEGLVRLEDRMRLKNVLTAADNGVGKWPSEKMQFVGGDRSGLHWDWIWTAAPMVIGLLMLAGAVLTPFPNLRAAVAALPPNEPGPWEQMDGWLNTLEEEELITEPVIEEYLEKVSQLRDQPEEEWFSHSSMEATDNLKESLQRDLKNLASDMGTLERDLSVLEKFSAEMSPEAKEMLMKEYEEAIGSLTSGNMPLSEALKKQLEGIDPSELAGMQMSDLSKEQLESLKTAMSNGAKAIGGMEGLEEGEGEGESLEDLLARLSEEEKGGRGRISVGLGEAPLFFGEESDLNTKRIDGVSNTDFSRVTPGDVLGTGETEHEVDKTAGSVIQSGGVTSAGKGGETVWKESLMPVEKAVLKKYFK